MVNLVGVKWYLNVIFIFIFLTSNNVEHLLICLLTANYLVFTKLP